MAFNIEAADINKDGKTDIIVGNWNDTYVYYGGAGILDDSIDLKYTGRMLAVCDYNGDGNKDLIAMHLTSYDTMLAPGPGFDPILDYSGEILFYYGSDTTELTVDTVADYSVPLPTKFPTFERFTNGYQKVGVEIGDFNNDGKSDLVFNSLEYVDKTSGNLEDYGTVYIYMGKEYPSDSADFMVRDSTSDYGNYFQVGNVNGDGYDDLLISSRIRTRNPSSPDSLAILYVYYGGNSFSFSKNKESVKYISRYNTVPGGLEGTPYSDWFRPNFSADDINGDGIDDIVVGGIGYGSNIDSTKIYSGSGQGVDTIPYLIFTNPDSTDDDYVAGGISFDIGDFNGDGYDDFVFPSGIIFSLQLGGPDASNKNPYGLRGLLEAKGSFPNKAIDVGDQNGDGEYDFAAKAAIYNGGTVIIMLGNHLIKTDIKKDGKIIKGFNLYQNYPNPFNPATTIKYEIPGYNYVTLKIYDTLGREIATLVNEYMSKGIYEYKFDAAEYNLSSGVYFYELKISNGHQIKKMMILK